VAAYRKELATQGALVHPNILPILDYSADDQELFVVTPLCRGGDVRALLEERDFLPVDISLRYLSQIAGAVDFAHRHGVIHGDLKPENVLLSEDGVTAYVSDFGAAKHFAIQEAMSTQPADLQRGTTAYMSPEQLVDAQQSPSSDVYSLAMVGFEMLTGKLPFSTTSSPYQQIRAKVDGELARAREHNARLPAHIDAALAVGLARDPKRRPQTASELVELLEGSRGVVAETPGPSKRRGLSRNEWVTIGIAVVGALATVLAALLGFLGDIGTALIEKLGGSP
jgi:eukaryotic-like serine/threonine-protein kinase